MEPSLVWDMRMSGPPPTVAVSVVTWNHAHCIKNCILSLLSQTRAPTQIFVCDNASADETPKVLETFKDRVALFSSPENLGFCGGHNVGIAQTQSDYVLLVNPDVVLREDYIEKAIIRMADDPRIGTVCGLLLQDGFDLKSSVIDGAGLSVGRNRRFLLRYHGLPASQATLRTEEVFGCDGALPCYRRAMIENVSAGGRFFDEMFFAHKEDHDVSWRAQLFGWKTVFDPECVAMHPRVFRPGNLQVRKQLAPDLKYHAVKNDLLLLLKNESASNFVKDFALIAPRRLGVIVYALAREPYSLKAYWFILRNWKRIRRMRHLVQQGSVVSPADMRKRFTRSSSLK